MQTSLREDSHAWNEVQAEIKKQVQEEARKRAKEINDDWRTKKAQQRITREQQERELRMRREQQEQEQQEQQEQQKLRQVQRHTHPESSFLENLGASLTRSVRKCLTSTEECLEPKIKEERERKERERHDEWLKLDTRYINDEYNREHPPIKWSDDLEDAKRNLEIAKQAAALVNRDDYTRSNAGWRELLRVRLNLENATKAVRAAELNRQRYNQGGNNTKKTKKTKRRHRKKSLRHNKKTARHRKKSLRHRKKSVKHRNNH